jgi:GntR family transcriptional regulator
LASEIEPTTSKANGRRLPKHRLIAERLLSQIETGQWRPGDQIPSEEQLASETASSLGTVQKALRNLVEMGVVVRHHGKGTFVLGARTPTRHLRHFRFMAEDSASLMPVYVKILDVALVEEVGPWTTFLGNPEEGYVRIRRTVCIAREFDIFSEFYLPGHRFSSLAQRGPKDLDGVSVRDLLAERYNAPTLGTRQVMLCQPLPPRVTSVIGVPAGTYGIVWTICGVSYRDAPITWQRAFVPPSDRGLEIVPGRLPGHAQAMLD